MLPRNHPDGIRVSSDDHCPTRLSGGKRILLS